MPRPSERQRTRSRASNAQGGAPFCGTGEIATAVEFAVPILLHGYCQEKNVRESKLDGHKHIKLGRSKDVPGSWINAGVVAWIKI